MWQSSAPTNPLPKKGSAVDEGNVTEFEDKCKVAGVDSGRVDSGFLSGENLQISSDLIVHGSELDVAQQHRQQQQEQQQQQQQLQQQERQQQSTVGNVSTVPEPMKTDSGVDLGLSESLSNLILKQVTLNPLASGKIQDEPKIELTPISGKYQDARYIHHQYQHHQQQQHHYQQQQHHYQQQQYQYQLYQQPQVQEICFEQRKPHDNVDKRLEEESWKLYYAQDDDGDTQLHIAIVQGFLDVAFSLIGMAPHPCLLNILNDNGQAPLHLAVLTGQPRIARRLILAGANPSQRNFRGNTALHLACATGDLVCAKALTDSLSPVERSYLLPGKKMPALPQNLEQRNYNGEMCLHVAASSGQVEVVRLLLRLGADLEAREALSGKTALHLAVERGCRSVVAFLLQECRPCLDTPTYAGITAYQLALCFDSQVARELVRLGATPQPLPETDSDDSDDDETSTTDYLPTITRLGQNVVGVRV